MIRRLLLAALVLFVTWRSWDHRAELWAFVAGLVVGAGVVASLPFMTRWGLELAERGAQRRTYPFRPGSTTDAPRNKGIEIPIHKCPPACPKHPNWPDPPGARTH